jgi:GWxTD domain-containing protein
MKTKLFVTCASVTTLSLTALLGIALAQSDQTDKKTTPDPAPRETVSKPMTEKQRKKQEKKLQKELETPYKKWLNEDVGYIISDEEKQAWKRLATDDERQQFIEQFWLRRDPTPDTEENEFKEEHYRRIAYANERFASGIPGWKTDRRTKSKTTPPAAVTSGPWKRAAAKRPPTRSNSGAIDIWTASAPTSSLNSSIPP